MKEKMLLTKTCSIYANELHFATVIFAYLGKEIKENTTIITILEKDEEQNIEKVMKSVGLNSKTKNVIQNIDWKGCNVEKIKNNLSYIKENINEEKDVKIIVQGGNLFIEKINKILDLWAKNNMEELENGKIAINIINCFSFEENKNENNMLYNYDYILKTSGLEGIIGEERLAEAN